MNDGDVEGRRIPLYVRGNKIGHYAVVDEDDYAALSAYKWFINNYGYAYRHAYFDGKKSTRLMHRDILGLERGNSLQVDHINRNRLDNRRSNLRRVTNAENHQNYGSKPGSTSKYRGVSWCIREQKWKAAVKMDNKARFIGYFDSEDDAGAAASEWRRKHLPFSNENASVA